MDSEKLRDIIIPVIVIGAGLFVKTTENKNYQDAKKLGKVFNNYWYSFTYN